MSIRYSARTREWFAVADHDRGRRPWGCVRDDLHHSSRLSLGEVAAGTSRFLFGDVPPWITIDPDAACSWRTSDGSLKGSWSGDVLHNPPSEVRPRRRYTLFTVKRPAPRAAAQRHSVIPPCGQTFQSFHRFGIAWLPKTISTRDMPPSCPGPGADGCADRHTVGTSTCPSTRITWTRTAARKPPVLIQAIEVRGMKIGAYSVACDSEVFSRNDRRVRTTRYAASRRGGITRRCSGPSRRVSFLWFESRGAARPVNVLRYAASPSVHRHRCLRASRPRLHSLTFWRRKLIC